MTKLTVPWRGEDMELDLPKGWRVQQVASAELKPATPNWPERLAVALDQPGTGPSLSKLLSARPKRRIVVIVEDVTRRGPLGRIIEVLMREIRFNRMSSERVEVVFATGMHPPMLAGEMLRKLGSGSAEVRWRCNSCRDDSTHVRVGRIGKIDVRIDREVADADLRLIVSSVSPHFQAGFGGGYRLIAPGCAHIDTIRGLSRLGMSASPRQLVGTEADVNPMRSMIDAVGLMVDQRHGRSVAVQYLLDEAGEPTSISAGEVIPTQRMLAKQCSVACGIVMDSPSDILVTNAYPRDFDLSQSLKCIAHTRWAVRPNGVILCLTPARIGLRDVRLPSWPLNPLWSRRLVRLVGPEAIRSLARRLAPGLARDADPYFRWAAQVFYRNPIVMYAPALYEAGLRLPGIQLVGTLPDAFAATERLLGAGPCKTVVFPAGGTTFPILAPATVKKEEAES